MDLTKTELAAIKRIATTVKTLNSKKSSIQSKINLMLLEIERINKEIDIWEKPVKEMTGGFTSHQVLDGTWKLAPKEDVEYYKEEDIINY